MRTTATILGLAAALASCTARRDPDTFIYCSEGGPTTFSPHYSNETISGNAVEALYEGLVRFRHGETAIEPALAESWTASQDGLSYTFRLRRGVRFHATDFFTPTREFNADDVLFSFNRQRLTDHPYHLVGGGAYEYFQGMEMGKIIKAIRRIDEHTVAIDLSRPEAPFLANMAMPFMQILSKEYADHLEAAGRKEEIDNLPVGTGPFVFQSYVKDSVLRYRAHPGYWSQGLPKMRNVVFSVTPDPSVRYQKLKAGECHLMVEPAPADLAAMRRDRDVKLMSEAGLNVAYLAMNMEKKPFDDVRVRRAVNHALNRQSYIDAIYLGNAQVAKNPMPPIQWGYDDSVQDRPHSVERAKALLAQAGHPDGFETELWTMPVTRAYNPNGRKMGEMMQADLAKVGIRARLVSYDWPTYLSKARAGEHQMLQLGWYGDNGDPDNFLGTLLSCAAIAAGSNYARYCDRTGFDKLVTDARAVARPTLEESMAERARLYRQAQKTVHEHAPWVPIAHSTVFRAMSPRVEGYRIHPVGGRDILTYVELK